LAADAPEGFRTVADGRGRLVVREDLLEAARALGLPDPAAIRALLAEAPGAGGRAAIARVSLPGHEERLLLRPVRHGGWLAPLWGDRLLGLARPIAELRTTESLRARGAPVPEAVLVAGWRAAPLWSAVLGTLEIPDARDALAWLETDPSPAAIERAARAAGRAIRRFHDAGGRHADLHLKNLLVQDGPEPRITVIDLDKGRAGAVPDAGRRMAELMRLYRSLLKRRVFERVGAGGRAAFFAGYTNGDAALARTLLEHWPRERRRVARHAIGYGAPR
jgi:3-deoxy-D-manno-octulosonic acid kinase